MNKLLALAEHLDVPQSDISIAPYTEYNQQVFEYGLQEYLVLTEQQRNTVARQRIIDSLWTFNYGFLTEHIPTLKRIPMQTFAYIQELCEGLNELLLALTTKTIQRKICDAAIEADGHGHYIATYDNEEREHDKYYIYRTN